MFYLLNSKSRQKLKNRDVIVTAGGTIEPIDPVRYIGNYSSGKMGIEIANVFRKYTKNVSLVYGKISVKIPRNISSYEALTPLQMLDVIKKLLTPNTILIMSAAVSDFKVANFSRKKIKKGKSISLKLVPEIDILKELSKIKKPSNFFVGFAAETSNYIKNAKKKLIEKNLDMIILNPIKMHIPFGSDFNEVFILTKNSITELPYLPKKTVAKIIFERIINEINKI